VIWIIVQIQPVTIRKPSLFLAPGVINHPTYYLHDNSAALPRRQPAESNHQTILLTTYSIQGTAQWQRSQFFHE